MFTEPFPFYVKLGWSIGAILLTVYPVVRVSGYLPLTPRSPAANFIGYFQFGIPAARKYIRRQQKRYGKLKAH